MSNKFETKSKKCLFIGYPKEIVEYQFYNPLEQKVFVSNYVVFLESAQEDDDPLNENVIHED